jgi:phosphatidylglycerophosphate synthase
MRLPDLHRTERVPEWETIPPEEWNEYQVRAAETNGWDTPGNRESLKGFVGSLAGLAFIKNQHHFIGTVCLGYGRLKDLQDGKRAHETGTKSPLGEAIDAVGDGALAVIAAPILEQSGIISTRERKALLGMSAMKFVTAGTAKLTGRELHATRLSKVGAFMHWIGLGAQLVGRVLKDNEQPVSGKVITTTGRHITYAGIALGAHEALGYAKETFLSQTKPKQPAK